MRGDSDPRNSLGRNALFQAHLKPSTPELDIGIELRAMRHLLPLLTDSLFVILGSYSIVAYIHSLLMFPRYPATLLTFETFFLIFQVLALSLIVMRKSAITVSSRITDYVCTMAALGSPMFFQTTPNSAGSLVSESLELAGGILVIGAYLSLNRSFGIAPENRGIKTRGIYRLVRHPMYLGYVLTETGFVMSNPSFLNLIILATATLFLVLRLNSEERLLREDHAYQEYAERTPWRLFPFFF